MTTADIFRHIADLADAASSHLQRLSADPEHEHLRALAADSVDAIMAAIEPIVTKNDMFMSPLPPCPIGHLTSWAIRGGRLVVREEASRWSLEVSKWASAVDKAGGVKD
jgi:hypothetical protein